VNFYTRQPAPSTVAPGSLVEIDGLNLGPNTAVTAAAAPWPTQLGGSQVTIGGVAAALYSVSAGIIIAEVPEDATAGPAGVIVQTGSGSSAPAEVTVATVAPAVQTQKDQGYGAPKAAIANGAVTAPADGLGPTRPPIATGDVPADGSPTAPAAALNAYIGGLRAKLAAAASTTTPGGFDVAITLPDNARAGDVITLLAAQQPANLTVYQPFADPKVEFLALPDGTPAIASLTTAGLRGDYLLALAARGSDGCYPAATVDLAGKNFAAISDCITSSGAAVFPLVAPAYSDSIGALIGPATGDAQSGVSSTVELFSPSGAPVSIALPSAATVLTATTTEIAATLPGSPAQTAVIDPLTAKVQITTAAGAGPASAAPVAVGGLTNIYATAPLPQGQTAVIAGDDPLAPTTAQFAVLDNTGAVVASSAFPAGWLPLLDAVPPARAATAAPKEPAQFDSAGNLFYVLARAADASQDAFLAFPLDGTAPTMLPFPSGWFTASCTSDIRLFNLTLTRGVVVAGSQSLQTAYQANCAGSGFLLLDLAAQSIAAVPLPDQAQLRVPSTKTDTSLASLNDYIYGVRLDPTLNGTSDTLYVLDAPSGSAYPIAVPAGVSGFEDTGLQPVPEINSLLAQTIQKTAGDQGFVLFDLAGEAATVFGVPAGFDTLEALSDGTTVCCMVDRQLALRAVTTGASSVVVFDLATANPVVVANPAGVTSFGPPTGSTARLAGANARANAVWGVAYKAAKQVGIMVVRLP